MAAVKINFVDGDLRTERLDLTWKASSRLIRLHGGDSQVCLGGLAFRISAKGGPYIARELKSGFSPSTQDQTVAPPMVNGELRLKLESSTLAIRLP